MAVLITGVEKKSPAAKARIKAGETLLTINGREITDVLDYRFYMPDTRLELTVEKRRGKHRTVTIQKEPFEEIGLLFETYLMDKQRSCRNNCIFCFIDQLPEGMRESLYFKDDDSRLSFLFGNYITLTNLSDRDVERIIEMHISPINVSVHTTNPELRCQMMNNRFAGDCLKHLYRFAEAGLDINCQLVLVPGYNDGEQLQNSMEALAKLAPAVRSVAAVPVGLTKYRENLPVLRGFTPEESATVIRQMTEMGDRMEKETGNRIFYPSDEWYIRAGVPIPEGAFYGEYPQLENGVGMIALLREEFKEAVDEFDLFLDTDRLVIATGVDAAPYLQELADYVTDRCPGVQLQVVPIRNEFFGESITVSGLITGGDLMKQLKDVPMDRLLLPLCMLRQEGDLFLDDVSMEQVEQTLGVPVTFIPETDGVALFEALFEDMFTVEGEDG